MGIFHTSLRPSTLAFLSIVFSFFAKAEEATTTAEHLEWQLPLDEQSYASLSVRVSKEKQVTKVQSFNGEVTISGKTGQSFIVCAQGLDSEGFYQQASTVVSLTFSDSNSLDSNSLDSNEGINIYVLTLNEKTGKLTITQSGHCPEYLRYQYPIASGQHIRSEKPFFIVSKRAAKTQDNQNSGMIPLASSPIIPKSLASFSGGGYDTDDQNDFKRPPFIPMPEKAVANLILLPTLNLPDNWRDYLPFAGIYHWLTDQPEAHDGLTLLVRFDGQPVITLRMSQVEFPDMAENLLNARRLLLWLISKLNGREALIQQLLDWAGNGADTGSPLAEETASVIRQWLLWAVEQPDTEFYLDIALQALSDDLYQAQHPRSSDQPVINQWPQGQKDHQPAQQTSAGSRQDAGTDPAASTQAAKQPSRANNADQKAGKSKEPVLRETIPKWLGGGGHYFVISLPYAQGQSGGSGKTCEHFYIDQKQLEARMKGEEKAATIEARFQGYGKCTIKLDLVEDSMSIPLAQRVQGTSTLAYLLRYGTPVTLLNLYRFYDIATLACVNGHLMVQRDQRDLRTEYQCLTCLAPTFSQDALITTPCCKRVYHPGCLAYRLQAAAESRCPGCNQITLKRLHYLFNTEDGKNKELLAATRSGSLSALKIMLKAGADPDTADSKGNTGLHLSVNRNHLRAIDLLLAFGANPVIRNQRQETAKDWATLHKYSEIVDDLELAVKMPSIFFKISHGDIDYVGRWLEDVNDIAITREPDGFTLLHLAVDHRHHGLAELLIQHEAGLNSGLLDKPDYSQRTPLHLACYNGDEPMVRLLLNAGADSSLEDLWQQTPEDVARVRNHWHLLSLPESTAPVQLSHTDYRLTLQPHEQGKNGKTALHEAAEKGDPEMIRLLIDKYGLNKEAKNESGNTPMDLAIMNSQPETIKVLHERGVAINTEHFFTAIENRQMKVIQLLVDLGGNPNQPGKWQTNYPPPLLNMAVLLKENEAIEAQVAAGVPPNSINKDFGRTPLFQAMRRGCPDTIRRLVKAGARLDQAVGSDHWTVLHHTVMAGNEEWTELLLELGAGTEVRDSHKRTPLHQAAFYGHVEVARQLIKAGADREAREQTQGLTPLLLAITSLLGQKMARMLIQQGARVDSQNNEGQNALHLIVQLFTPKEVEAFALEFDTPEILASWQMKDHKGRTPAEESDLPFIKGLSAPRSAKGTTALIAAAKTGNSRQIEVLLKAGVPSGQTDSWGWTPLHYAVKYRQQDVIHLLVGEQTIKALTPALSFITNSQTPLHMANADNNFPMAKALLEHEANPVIANNQGVTPLHQMLSIYSAGQLQALHPLLKNYLPGLINQPDDRQRTPIQLLRNRADIPMDLVTLFSQKPQAKPPEPAKQQVRAGLRSRLTSKQ